MTCVNDTLPPRALARWLLMTMRLSHSSLTGTLRTLVAVGTVRLRSMFCTVRAGAPRRGDRVGSSVASARAAGAFSLGTGPESFFCGEGCSGCSGCSGFLASLFLASGFLGSGFLGSDFWGSDFWGSDFWSGFASDLLAAVLLDSAAFFGGSC